jgi:hypothetical protein
VQGFRWQKWLLQRGFARILRIGVRKRLRDLLWVGEGIVRRSRRVGGVEGAQGRQRGNEDSHEP